MGIKGRKRTNMAPPALKNEYPDGRCSPKAEGQMESRRHWAYNQTKKCLICSEVVVGDRLRASLGEQLPGFTPNSYSGLWIVPFTGFPDKGIRVQLDLIYLD